MVLEVKNRSPKEKFLTRGRAIAVTTASALALAEVIGESFRKAISPEPLDGSSYLP